MRLQTLASYALLAGCAVGPDFHRPSTPTIARYTSAPTAESIVAGGQSERLVAGADVDPAWWTAFGSPELNAAVTSAIAHNAGLEAARATLSRSQHLLRAGYGVFLPQLDAKAGVTRQRYNPAPGVLPSRTFDLFTASGSVSYTVDVWGGERRQVEGLAAQVDEQRYALATARVMLAGNVLNAEIARAAQIEATEASRALQREQLRITEAQVAGGTVSAASALTIRSQIAAIEATLPGLEQKIDEATHLLATLDGVTPGEWHRAPVKLDALTVPAEVPVSLPSVFVRQRPDILEAEAVAHAANASIGVATAAMLPNITLGGSYGANSRTVGGFGGPDTIVWNLAAGVVQPIFHGGTLNEQRKAAIEARNAVLAGYRQTVLAAFADVANTLRALEHNGATLRAETEAVETADNALRLVQANYSAGIANYLQFLVADGLFLTTRIARVQAVAQRLQDTVALFVALGGGWQKVPSRTLERP